MHVTRCTSDMICGEFATTSCQAAVATVAIGSRDAEDHTVYSDEPVGGVLVRTIGIEMHVV